MDARTYQKLLTANNLLESVLDRTTKEDYLPELHQLKVRQDAVMRAVLYGLDAASAVNFYIDSIKELDNAVNGGLHEI